VSEVRCRRAVSEGDISDLARLRYTWRVEEHAEVGLDEKEFESRLGDWMRRRRETHLGYLAYHDDVAIGCAWLCIIDRIPGPASFIRRSGALQSVYVRPALRDSGVGSELVRFVVREARAMELAYLGVHPTERSFAFYRRLGFDTADRALELRF
jgi:GNAT superfamily N-acetyltransferase